MTTSSPPLAIWEPGNHYTQVCCRRINGRQAVAWFSTELEDTRWDDFLEATPLGQYQQSSRWAQAKKVEGWQPLRVILTLEQGIAGGFQILTRKSRFGYIGYVSKGPVVIPEAEPMVDFILEQVVSIVKANRLAALILQPPDQSSINGSFLTRHRFFLNQVVKVIDATLLVDVSPDWQEIERRMRKSTCKQVKQAKRRGIIVREGQRQDIGKFFQLMTATCQRQKTKPSPATEAALQEIWQTFGPSEHARLFLAEYEANPIAGLLCLCFGQTVVAWKKGWSGEHAERHPNVLLTFEAIKWAHDHAYHFVDFCAYPRDLAQAYVAGDPLPENSECALYWFNLGFGSRPVMLPESHIYLNNPLFQFFRQSTLFTRWSQKLAKALVAQGV